MKNNEMIWLASFPRSGNTFFRNILYFVYGLESSTYGIEDGALLFEDYLEYPVVKTHVQPQLVVPKDPDIPVIYLIRDGRDSLVSLAHHKKDIVEPGTLFLENLQEAIIAAQGSYFGGWSRNALEWIKRADVVIRFEDLVADPKRELARCRDLLQKGEGNWDNLPNFEQLKKGKGMYTGDHSKKDREKWEGFSKKFFRKGKSKNWKTEMPEEMQALFWALHGPVMEQLGYQKNGNLADRSYFEEAIRQIKASADQPAREPSKRILVEASKLEDFHYDGIKRYVEGLVLGLRKNISQLQGLGVDLFINGNIVPLTNYETKPPEEKPGQTVPQLTLEDIPIGKPMLYERVLLNVKKGIRTILPDPVYRKIREIYLGVNVRALLFKFREFALESKYKKPSRFLSEKYDLIHITLPQDCLPFKKVFTRYLVTVHDLTHLVFPKFHVKENLRKIKFGFRFIEERESDVLAVSKNTANDLLSHYELNEEKIHVVYEGVDFEKFRIVYNDQVVRRVKNKYEVPEGPYFVSMFTLEPRKNLERTILAFNKVRAKFKDKNPQLVVIGKLGWMEAIERFQSEGIHFTGYVLDEDVPPLLNGSIGFCYLSLYEGFGLPLIEAMRCKIPVIYGNNSSMREIVGEYGLAADAEDVEAIATQMGKLLSDEDLRDELAMKGYKKSLEFTWEKASLETIALYRQVLSHSTVDEAGNSTPVATSSTPGQS